MLKLMICTIVVLFLILLAFALCKVAGIADERIDKMQVSLDREDDEVQE